MDKEREEVEEGRERGMIVGWGEKDKGMYG